MNTQNLPTILDASATASYIPPDKTIDLLPGPSMHEEHNECAGSMDLDNRIATANTRSAISAAFLRPKASNFPHNCGAPSSEARQQLLCTRHQYDDISVRTNPIKR